MRKLDQLTGKHEQLERQYGALAEHVQLMQQILALESRKPSALPTKVQVLLCFAM